MSECPDSVRLDIWLWRARFFKTRGIAAAQISKRGARIGRSGQIRRIVKPAASVSVGDVLTFQTGSHIHIVEIQGLGVRRGPATEAQSLYRRLDGDNAC
ncbi:MAG: RNA-binding S4 domain-containing protein [Pseudomonadota bacterium]